KKTKRIEHFKLFKFLGIENIIITLIMLMFSIFGAVFGMSEETIAFVIIFVPLALSMGYDSIVGVNMCFVAAGLGFAGALLNPFTIGIAQGLSGIPLFTGIEYRLFTWFVLNFIGIVYILRYAKKIKKDPKLSLVFENDNENWRNKEHIDPEHMKYHTPVSAWIVYGIISVVLVVISFINSSTTLSIGNSSTTIPVIPVLTGIFIILGPLVLRKSVHFFILNILLFTILFLIVGVMGYGWYVMEIATLFFAMGLAAGIANNKSPNNITKLFIEGVKDIASAALIVGLAGGIIIVLQEGKIIDTILNSVSQSMKTMGKVGSIGIMYLIQTFINIIIPSGSAKAALTMPIMAPFSDLIGISRQATVMAFQFGDGFTNMITPTSGVLIGVLGVAKIPYEKWVKWITPFMIILIITGFLLLIPTVLMELNGF
ncbi:MAG: AbgT family transporter, partial [Bacteroidales bacterium]|nr:AbgT family transporter [Bacteroidales bacterium]